jgi:tetratricopeptide (TPR) repeat protein
MNNIINLIFWVYYAQGLLYKSLQKYKEAIEAFDSALDFQQYYAVLCEDPASLKTELSTHQKILREISKSLNRKVANSNELASKNTAENALKTYDQITGLFSKELDDSIEEGYLSISKFGVMFDIPFTGDEGQSFRLQCAYAHYNKALTLLLSKEAKQALSALDIASKLVPEFCQPYIEKANIYKEQKKYAKALVQYDKAIAIEYDNSELYFNRSVVLFELGKTTDAKNDFAKYQKLQNQEEGLKLYDEPQV